MQPRQPRSAARSLADDAGASLTGEADSDGFGSALGFVGDVDGDGADDVAIASVPSAGDAQTTIFSGATLDSTPTALAVLTDDPKWQRQGIFPAGDVDDDGLDDFWVAAPFRLVLGGSGDQDLTGADTTIEEGGWSEASLRATTVDVDLDGSRDLFLTNGHDLYLFEGPFEPGDHGHGDASLHLVPHGSNTAGETADAADFDGDGVPELLAGENARSWLSSGVDANVAAFPSDLTGTVAMSATEQALFWISYDSRIVRAASAGDATGDGYPDLLVAGDGWSMIPGPLSGEVIPDQSAVLTFDPQPFVAFEGAANDELRVGTAGDLDDDGAAEIWSFHAGPGAAEDLRPDGALYVVRGGQEGAIDAANADASWVGQASDSSLGAAVASGGDADGDGLPDLLVGMQYAPGDPHPGHVYWLPGAILLGGGP